MLVLILFVATVATVCLLTVWTRPGLAKDAEDVRRSEDATSGGVRPLKPESLEGVLVAQLLAAEISQLQYQHAIEGLAARDEDRHPLAVPPEIGPADA